MLFYSLFGFIATRRLLDEAATVTNRELVRTVEEKYPEALGDHKPPWRRLFYFHSCEYNLVTKTIGPTVMTSIE